MTKERKERVPQPEHPFIVHNHASTWHDGSAAMLLPDGKIVALAAERVGDRYKHSWNSRLAYEHLRDRYAGEDLPFGEEGDNFRDQLEGLETTNHHMYHASSAFYGSGFDEAAILVVDGQGPDFDGKRAKKVEILNLKFLEKNLNSL